MTPIGRKGVLSEDDRRILTVEEIYKKQNQNRIELHHITQKDIGEDNPIVEMTRATHHGSNARLILERNPVSHLISVVHSCLEKEQVDVLLKNHQFAVSNVFHFRTGPSLIDRDEWNEVRIEYWKARAEKIKMDKESPPSETKWFLFKKSIFPDVDTLPPQVKAR